MTATLFTNVRIIDGDGKKPFNGQVLVKGNRIKKGWGGFRGPCSVTTLLRCWRPAIGAVCNDYYSCCFSLK